MSEPTDKPLALLTQFASALGWQDLRINQHRWLDGEVPVVTTWYESGVADGRRSDFFLQINEAPNGQAVTLVGAVYAMRYGICTGWHPFKLFPSAREIAAEAANVESWLHRRWFETLYRRREFRQLHPECCNYTWSRIREQGPPYPQEGRASG